LLLQSFQNWDYSISVFAGIANEDVSHGLLPVLVRHKKGCIKEGLLDTEKIYHRFLKTEIKVRKLSAFDR
jgi:hypothetical protein